MYKFSKLKIGNIVKTIGNKCFRKLVTTIRQLVAPVISLDGDTLTITDESGLAEEFEILVDGEVKATVTPATTCKLWGTWRFNESISIAGIGGSWNAINFTSNGVSYIAISDRRNMSVVSHDAIIRYFTSSSNYVEVCDLASDAGWTDDTYRQIDFGTTPQIVSKEFYDWFTANAEPDHAGGSN